MIVVFSIEGCPHCDKVKAFFKSNGWEYTDIDIGIYPDKRTDMISLCDRMSVPQIFFGAHHVGGATDLFTLEKDGQLKSLYEKTKASDTVDKRLVAPDYPPPIDNNNNSNNNSNNNTNTSFVEESYVIFGKEWKISEILVEIIKNIKVKDKWVRCRRQNSCFEGTELVNTLKLILLNNKCKEINNNNSIDNNDNIDIIDNIDNNNKIIKVCEWLYASGGFISIGSYNAFYNDYHLYRFHYHQQNRPLNQVRLLTPQECLSARPNSIQLVRKLQKLWNELKVMYTDDNGNIDMGRVVEDDRYTCFQFETVWIQAVSLDSLGLAERKAFCINLYNFIVPHAFAELGTPSSSLAIRSFFDTASYNIGSHVYSLNDIENGTLRGNKKAPVHFQKFFRGKDPRLSSIMPEVDCRIHFALNCGAVSCPPVKSFTAESIEEELRVVSMSFLEDITNFTVDTHTHTVKISKILQWYSDDFGENTEQMLKRVCEFLRGKKKEDLEIILREPKKVNLTYFDYNWSNNYVTKKTFTLF
eukprot:GHVR01148944.1.p1 GENE.GHVR01148944.1~~GHVR01148944.1.p1  ORF type:complete len:527 (+),score=103.03 GHVR01148944.1:207-1787(+)